jgi:hypothetical protein
MISESCEQSAVFEDLLSRLSIRFMGPNCTVPNFV